MGIHFMLCVLSYLILATIPIGIVAGWMYANDMHARSCKPYVIQGAIAGVFVAIAGAAFLTCIVAVVHGSSGLSEARYSWEWPEQKPRSTPAEAH